MNKFPLSLLLLFTSLAMCCAQNDFRKSFSDFATSTRQQYEEYSKKANEEFSKALQENWRSFKVFDAKVRTPLKPVSDTLLPACPLENEQIDISDVPVDYKKSRSSSKTTNATAPYAIGESGTPQIINVSFTYYGKDVMCKIPAGYMSLRLDGSSERIVSRFWNELSQKGVECLTKSLKKAENEMSLNDWALFEYADALSSVLFPGKLTNEKAVFTVFCMNQLGLNCKIARTDTSLVPLFASEQEIYGRKYVIVEGTKYYFADTDINPAKLDTYSVKLSGVASDMDMNINDRPKFGNGSDSFHKVNSSVLKGSFSLPLDNALISFYKDYPQLDVNIYAGAEPEENFSKAIIASVKPKLAGKSQVAAVNTLLEFVQKDFKYKTDTDQFGKEKPFFCEENFYYPYNDCEDRAVLFSFLVRKLLGFDCLLLQYNDHVNCAVRIDGGADGYYVRRGDNKYYVCDPTCQGARVGMSGKDYRIKPERIWVL